MRRATRVWAIVAALVVSAASVGSQENLRVLRPEGFPSPQRPPVGFVHDAHNEKAGIDACNECHHVYADGQRVSDESSEDRRCSDCHGLSDDGRQPGLMKAFHLNCKGCHLEKRGPVMCAECHVRR